MTNCHRVILHIFDASTLKTITYKGICLGSEIATKTGEVNNPMSSKIRTMVLIVGLALVALAGFCLVSQHVRNTASLAASAVWGS